MKPPKLCRDWIGLRVRPRWHMATNGGDHFYPSDELLVRQLKGGYLDLNNPEYGVDDLRTGIRDVHRNAVEIIGPETDEQASRRRIRSWEVREALLIAETEEAFGSDAPPRVPVSDDFEDAPEGARIGHYQRRGFYWVRVSDSHEDGDGAPLRGC